MKSVNDRSKIVTRTLLVTRLLHVLEFDRDLDRLVLASFKVNFILFFQVRT